jgi:hypothetical protein
MICFKTQLRFILEAIGNFLPNFDANRKIKRNLTHGHHKRFFFQRKFEYQKQ